MELIIGEREPAVQITSCCRGQNRAGPRSHVYKTISLFEEKFCEVYNQWPMLARTDIKASYLVKAKVSRIVG